MAMYRKLVASKEGAKCALSQPETSNHYSHL